MVNGVGDASSPDTNSYHLVPQLPDQHGLLTSLEGIPGIVLLKAESGRKDGMPLPGGKVIDLMLVAEQGSALLRGVFHDTGVVRPD